MPQTMPEIEHRHFAGKVELHQNADSNEVKLTGYGMKWGIPFNQGFSEFDEVFEKGAFADTLSKHDQLLFIEHRPPGIARRSRGTLELSEDSTGLRMSATIDLDDMDSKSAYVKLKRGDIQALSIGFTMFGESEQEWNTDADGKETRTIKKVAELYEVSLTSIPVFEDATVALRHRDLYHQTRFYPAIARSRMNMRHRELQSLAGE